MKAQHTPEPWHIEKAFGRYEIWPKDNGQTHTFVGVAQKEADAFLFVAAPALLRACETALDVGEIRFETCVLSKQVKAQLQAAIAQAKGEKKTP